MSGAGNNVSKEAKKQATCSARSTSSLASVRGGGEFGRKWKLDGMLGSKMNTFTDFISVTEHLIEKRYTHADRLAIEGNSTGGLLTGAVINLRPDLFKGAVPGVPFVDVVNTMLDVTIPLTVTEWEEWGNPNQTKDYESLKAYSPYDNVEEKAYPSMLVLAGLNDPRVHYWEPAKCTARLRANKTDDNACFLKTNMGRLASEPDSGGGCDSAVECLGEYAENSGFFGAFVCMEIKAANQKAHKAGSRGRRSGAGKQGRR